MKNKNKILSKIIDAISENAPDSEIYSFGSRARGDSKKLSDWDLLILLNSDNVPFSLETSLIDSLFEVELETGEVISPIIYSKKDWYSKYAITTLYNNIEKEGKRIK